MLTEARAMSREGVDLVIAYFEPHDRLDTIALTDGLEIVPRQLIGYRGVRLEEMDTQAVLARRPRVAVVDELPHTNAPGSPREKRWEDVHELLDAGIDVMTTMNVQHLESLNDQIWQITGIRVRETVPDWVVQQADDVVMVDLTPRALLNRLTRGVVYSPERARAALENFFREPTLVALRELAMRQAASVMESRRPVDDASVADTPEVSDRSERVLLLVGPEPSSAALIRRGRRVADGLRAECLAVHVSRSSNLGELAKDERERLERHLNFARALQIETRILEGRDVAGTLLAFARANGVTQIFVDRNTRSADREWFGRSLIERIVNGARGLQVTVVADRTLRSGV
jgi:two-component system, OmpR family, sensor histidine kinase KdpD